MKQVIIFLLLSITLFFVFCEDKSTSPPNRDDPGYYYPRQTGYGWRYIELIKPGCYETHDSFDLEIVGIKTRDSNRGYDRLKYRRGVSSDDTVFIYVKGDAIIEESVKSGTKLYVLVGPIEAGKSWKDGYWEYFIQRLENVTLTIDSSVTYKGCAKIMKRKSNSTTRIYEWWAPQFGKVREERRDANGVCQRAEELRYFTPTGFSYP